MLSTLITILPIFFLIILGKILRDYFFKNEEFWRTSEKITYYVFFPALLINALSQANFHHAMHGAILALVLATLFLAVVIIVIQFFVKTETRSFTSLFQGAIRYNSYIFIGAASALFGDEGIAIVAIIISYMIILTNALSVLILDIYLNGNLKNIFSIAKNVARNPLIIASLIGILLNPFQTYIPLGTTKFLDYLGGAALALSLICVGAGLNLKHLYHKRRLIFSASIAKLIILPALVISLLTFFQVEGLAKSIAVLYAAVPCAGNSYILAQQMGGDAETMAGIISVTTLLSILTIPLILTFWH